MEAWGYDENKEKIEVIENGRIIKIQGTLIIENDAGEITMQLPVEYQKKELYIMSAKMYFRPLAGTGLTTYTVPEARINYDAESRTVTVKLINEDMLADGQYRSMFITIIMLDANGTELIPTINTSKN